MKFFRILFLITLCLVTIASVSAGSDDRQSSSREAARQHLKELYQILSEHTAVTINQELALEVVTADHQREMAWAAPELRPLYGESPDQNETHWELGLRFNLPNPAQNKIIRELSEVEKQLIREEAASLFRSMKLALKRIYWEVVDIRVQESRLLLQVEEQTKAVDFIQQKVAAGQAGIADQIRAESVLLDINLRLGELADKFIRLETSLLRWGVSAEELKNIQPLHNLSPAEMAETMDTFLSENVLMERAEASRYELILARCDVEDATLQVALERAGRKPWFSFVQAQYGQRDNGNRSTREDEWGLRFGIEIPIFDRHDENYRKKQQQYLESVLEQRRATIKVDITTATHQVTRNYENWKERDALLEHSIKNLEALMKKAESGDLLTPDALSAQKIRLLELEIIRWQLTYQWVEDTLTLEEAVGCDLAILP